ncbi:MAG: TraB/GumN family protein [Defluviitaleaceae bacterium]|nr:TraB/GumN family protein [Defluviitaleaceae bacterium]
MKKFLALLLAVLIFTTPVFADIPTMTINGNEYVQLRAVADAHGYTLEWDDEYKKVRLTSPSGDEFAILTTNEEGVLIDRGRVFVWSFYAEMFFGSLDGQVPENPEIHGMLTRVTYGDNVAYVFGSMHASRPHWFPLADIAEDAMRRADVFVFEVDMVELADLSDEQRDAIEEMQHLPDGKTLEDILPSDVLENFIEVFETYEIIGLTFDNISNLTPVAIMTSLESIMVMLLGVDLGVTIDSYIANFAEENDLPIIGLNDILNEMEIVFDIPLEIQALALVDFPDFFTMLDSFGEAGIVEIYVEQDIERLRELFRAMRDVQQGNEYAELMAHNMFYVRSNLFADEIARLLVETDEPTTFFVTVGMGHIIGCDGSGGGMVLQRLRDMDFDVTSLWEYR